MFTIVSAGNKQEFAVHLNWGSHICTLFSLERKNLWNVETLEILIVDQIGKLKIILLDKATDFRVN